MTAKLHIAAEAHMAGDYSDLINLPRHVSTKHQPMSIDSRAAQFAPYAALVGHKEIIAQNEKLASENTTNQL